MYEDALKEHGSERKAAIALGVAKSTFHDRLVKERSGLPDGPTKQREEATPQSIIPEGYRVKGTSTMYDADGVPRMQWVKTDVDREAMEAVLKAAVDAFTDAIPRAQLTKHEGGVSDADHLCMFVLTDAHVGMAAWAEETRSGNWDLKIAEDTIVKWIVKAVEMAPKTNTCVLAQLGDYVHYTSLVAQTPTSGHPLDADGRFQKMIRVAIRVMRRVIAILLTKYEHVHIIPAAGNHDDAAAGIFKETFPIFYENEPRVTFDTTPSVYHFYEFGNVSLYFTHGHKSKFGSVDRVMASLFSETFGRTSFRYCHQGHLHHSKKEEGVLMEQEIHPTLAAPDAYAALNGYISKRSASCVVYHRDYGEVNRIKIPVEMLKAAA